jgi:hypothetical protein
MSKRKLILSDSDDEIPPASSPPDTPPALPPSKRARQQERQQASLKKFRACEYMRRPEDRTMAKFRAYFQQDEAEQTKLLKPPRSLKRFERYDASMQALRSKQRAERCLTAAPNTAEFACHVCGTTAGIHLQCQMRISKQKAWPSSCKPPEGYTSKTWWRKARARAEQWALRADRLKGVFAVLKSHWLWYKRAKAMDELSVALDASPLDFITDFFDPDPLIFRKPRALVETSLTSASLATVTFLQECGQYICNDCCVRERMPRNLDLSNESFCLDCYHRGTRREDFERNTQARLDLAALAYREQRPQRSPAEEKAARLPKPSTLLTDRSVNGLWVGGSGRQLIRRVPRNGSTYTHTELNGLLKTVENVFYNRTASFQVMYTLEPDDSRPWALTRAECYHHCGPEVVRILMRHYAVAPDDTFVLPELLQRYATNGEPDEDGDSDCELLD